MKRCPQCGREYDLTMSYCLDDGSELLYGPATAASDEPRTAILHDSSISGEAATKAQIHSTSGIAALPSAKLSSKRSFDLRLLALPVLLIALAVGGFFGYRYLRSGTAQQVSSIAVLPFENRSGNSDTDYLSDGLADSLIYRLSQLPDLKVSPTSSVMRYKGKDADIAQIAKELNVDAIMSGRLVQLGDSLNISVQLIDARTSKLIWAEQYDRKMSDLLATQREIATAITQKLQLKLAGDEKGITKKYTDSNEAYQLYLKGRYHFAKRTKEGFEQAIDCYRQAIAVDPKFALAYARIAEAYNQMPSYPYALPEDSYPKAKAAAQRSLSIDPSLAEAHAALANSLVAYDRDWPAAEREFKQAITSDPNSSAAHFRYGQLYLLPRGQFEESIVEIKRGLDGEPLDLNMGGTLSWAHLLAGQKQAAMDTAMQTYALDPNHPTGRYNYGLALIANGRFEEALTLSSETRRADPNNQFMLQVAGVALAKMARPKEANEVIAQLAEMSKTRYVMSYYAATIYAALGERDKAFVELEHSDETRDWRLLYVKVDPLTEPLRDDPRFTVLLKRMNLAD